VAGIVVDRARDLGRRDGGVGAALDRSRPARDRDRVDGAARGQHAGDHLEHRRGVSGVRVGIDQPEPEGARRCVRHRWPRPRPDGGPGIVHRASRTPSFAVGRVAVLVIAGSRVGWARTIYRRTLQVSHSNPKGWAADERPMSSVEAPRRGEPADAEPAEPAEAAAGRWAGDAALWGEELPALAAAFAHAPQGMTLATPDRRSLRVNRAFAAMLGWTVEELQRMADPSEWIRPDDRAADRERLATLLASGAAATHWQKRFLHRDGHTVWGEVSVAVVREAAGNALHLVELVENVTDRRDSERGFAALLELVPGRHGDRQRERRDRPRQRACRADVRRHAQRADRAPGRAAPPRALP